MLAVPDAATCGERAVRGGCSDSLDSHTPGAPRHPFPDPSEIFLRNVKGRQAPGVHK